MPRTIFRFAIQGKWTVTTKTVNTPKLSSKGQVPIKCHKGISVLVASSKFLTGRRCLSRITQCKKPFRLMTVRGQEHRKSPLKAWLVFEFLSFVWRCIRMAVGWKGCFSVKICWSWLCWQKVKRLSVLKGLRWHHTKFPWCPWGSCLNLPWWTIHTRKQSVWKAQFWWECQRRLCTCMRSCSVLWSCTISWRFHTEWSTHWPNTKRTQWAKTLTAQHRQ